MPTENAFPMCLDGGTATELQRAGLPMAAPWWTSAALRTEQWRRVLRSAHADYLRAGAEVLTANTFRCNLRALRATGLDAAGPSWFVQAAVGVAAAARNDVPSSGALIAGSMAPVEDCYRPELVPPDEELRVEHRWLATELVRAGVDLVLIETMNTLREARIALQEVLAAGGRAWVSFVCADGGRLLSGESVAAAARTVEADGAEVVLVNCTALAETEDCLRLLGERCHGPFGAYPNLEDRGALPRGAGPAAMLPAAASPAEFADTLRRWHRELGASVLGGCCGTSPAHIAALNDRLRRSATGSDQQRLNHRRAAARS
ncbi:MAG TPA: homocysteine S-methyltransferase family protein [Jatrophihabitans sp.]|jgi:S-methylmethionine-dependent homocysteine/selenocysteine methylase|uniref:homocysteine S-methyltransferase family protein n=1 Tax=Jatrophihabitans sp. TaxID=1932789 RepID=UPI002EE403B7